MRLAFATNNAHKARELAAILQGHELLLPRDLGIDFSHEETEDSFVGNSLGKALALFELAGIPALADDSGLVVDALGGEPGVYSARYGSEGGRELSAGEKNALVLTRMRGRGDRACRFVCCMTVVLGPGRFYSVQETLEGVLAEEGRGDNGFGYDPIVFLPEYGKTVAEIGEELKNKVSHRAKAALALAKLLG